MRVLITCVPAYGHFHPLVPLARALVQSGHEVAVATADSFSGNVRHAGLVALTAGLSDVEVHGELQRRYPRFTELSGIARSDALITDLFVGTAAPAMVADLVPICERWQPDVLLHEEGEFGGPVAAAVAGVPWVTHSWGPIRPQRLTALAEEAAVPLWEAWGQDPAPAAGAHSHMYIDICPPALQAPHIADVTVALTQRPVGYDVVDDAPLPDWVERLPNVPTVYFTLGTVVNRSASVFTTVLNALRGAPYSVIATVGPSNDPAMLGEQAANVHIERYLPQTLLLPNCDLVVSHGGSSTVLGAMSHGLPVLLLPQGPHSQAWNAAACVAAGVGRSLDPGFPPEMFREAVADLLSDPCYRRRAERIAHQIQAMPEPSATVARIEALL